MRTTVRLPDALLADAKRFAAESGRSFTALLEDALLELLRRRRTPPPENPPLTLTTAGGEGLLPGVDLDDTAALLELMESPGDHD